MERMLSLILFITLLTIGIIILLEVFSPGFVEEGFANILPKTSYWSSFIAPRTDVDDEKEDSSLIRDPRYFNGYSDVSRLGQNYDFCRMVSTSDEPDNLFFACALAGTEKTDSTKFRTESVKDGFRISYDDYMRDINGDGRADYCRILKWKDGTFQPVCARAKDFAFDSREVVDQNPPENIETLLRFYDGCVLWLRFMNDMKDSVENVNVAISGKILIDEKPRVENSEGIQFNGSDQFLRLSDSSDLSLGMNVPLRSVRAWMIWVYFDEFTNNAKFFDFGNGSGKDNVFLGILGKGDSAVGEDILRPLLCGREDSTVPEGSTGAQPVSEVSPEELMKTSDANVNEYTCVGFDVKPRILPKSSIVEPPKKLTGKATLIYEVWDKQARKMRVKVNNAIPLKRWTHVCVTAMGNDAFRPNIAIYINGKKFMEKESGWLPATSSMTNCYMGKSNWANDVSQYENRDELFKGRLFDFRAYRRSLSEDLIQMSYDWGKEKLNAV